MMMNLRFYPLLLLQLLTTSTTTAFDWDKLQESFKDFFTDDHCLRAEKDVSKLKDLSSWMSNVADLNFMDVTFPGSHNSVAYDLTTDINRDDPEYVKVKEGITTIGLPEEYFAQWICGYALTQSLSISEQLQAGIRYLDMSIDYDGSSFRGVHLMFGKSAEELLTQIKTFLTANENEVVVIEVDTVYADITEAQFLELQTIFVDTLGESLLIPTTTDLTSVTFGDLVDAGTRVLLVAADQELTSDKIWRTNQVISSSWPQTADVTTMVDFNDQQLALFESGADSSSDLFKIQWIVTPDEEYIEENPIDGTLYLLAEEANAELTSFGSTGQQLGNILSIDFLEISDIFQVLDLEQYSSGPFVPEVTEDQSFWTGARKAGLIAGIVLLVLGCCCVKCFCCKKRKR